MKEWIDLFFQMIGIATVTSTAVIGIRIAFDKYIRGLNCKHEYTVQGRLKIGKENTLFLKCNKCGKEKRIEICDGKFTIELEGEVYVMCLDCDIEKKMDNSVRNHIRGAD